MSHAEPHIQIGHTAKVSRIPDCDFCVEAGAPAPALYDGATVGGAWAFMCGRHFSAYGVGLGTGLGQELIAVEEDDPNKLKRELHDLEVKIEGKRAELLKFESRRDSLRLRLSEVAPPPTPLNLIRVAEKRAEVDVRCRFCNKQTRHLNGAGIAVCKKCQDEQDYMRIMEEAEGAQ